MNQPPRNPQTDHNKQGQAKIPRPDIRDNLDSRANLEQRVDANTNNKKATADGDDAKTKENDPRGS